MSEPTETNKPEKTFRSGALSVSVWKRRHNDDVFYNATPQRAYKAKDESWQYTDSFGRDDLPIVGALLQQAFAFIVATEAKAKEVQS